MEKLVIYVYGDMVREVYSSNKDVELIIIDEDVGELISEVKLPEHCLYYYKGE
jgi:hypothetical protein